MLWLSLSVASFVFICNLFYDRSNEMALPFSLKNVIYVDAPFSFERVGALLFFWCGFPTTKSLLPLNGAFICASSCCFPVLHQPFGSFFFLDVSDYLGGSWKKIFLTSKKKKWKASHLFYFLSREESCSCKVGFNMNITSHMSHLSTPK